MTEPTRAPGWDKKAVNRIAAEQYGGLERMFEAHAWTKPENRTFGQIAPKFAKATYGSISAFELAHREGVDRNAMLDPLAATTGEEPDVWLKSFYGFTPEAWGFVGFADMSKVQRLVSRSKPGLLMVIYGTDKAEPDERRRVLGVLQLSHQVCEKWDYLRPEIAKKERADPSRRDKWVHALRIVRAWRVSPESRPRIEEFAPDTYTPGGARAIGAYSQPMSANEVQNLLKLDLVEVPVYGQVPVDSILPQPAKKALRPSKPGPVSQSGYTVREAEGPKHLYILRMGGPIHALLGEDPEEALIVKVGFSRSPETRCDTHNKALPAGTFRWTVWKTTFEPERDPLPSSQHAIAGEDAMKTYLDAKGKSLGGEFFLASPKAIKKAWKIGVETAENWKP